MIHIEARVGDLFRYATLLDFKRLREIKDLRINLMIQSMDTVASFDEVAELRRLGRLTCTTAHEKYSQPELGQKYGCHLYKFSVFVSPEKYTRKLVHSTQCHFQ